MKSLYEVPEISMPFSVRKLMSLLTRDSHKPQQLCRRGQVSPTDATKYAVVPGWYIIRVATLDPEAVWESSASVNKYEVHHPLV